VSTGREPSLSHTADNAPMLGGDRKLELCLACGATKFRDFFGNAVCLDCAENVRQLADLLDNPACPHCGDRDSLFTELTMTNHVLYVFCESCSQQVWLIPNYELHRVARAIYLTDYGFESWDGFLTAY